MDIRIHSSFLAHPPALGDDITEEERELLRAPIAKGSYFGVNLVTDDLDGAFARIEAADADIVQEPIEQDYGVRDAAFRDPAGNMIRLQQTGRPTATEGE